MAALLLPQHDIADIVFAQELGSQLGIGRRIELIDLRDPVAYPISRQQRPLLLLVPFPPDHAR